MPARKRWYDYSRARDLMLEKTDTKDAPWHIVPADQNWYKAYAVAAVLRDALAAMNPQYPASKAARPK